MISLSFLILLSHFLMSTGLFSNSAYFWVKVFFMAFLCIDPVGSEVFCRLDQFTLCNLHTSHCYSHCTLHTVQFTHFTLHTMLLLRLRPPPLYALTRSSNPSSSSWQCRRCRQNWHVRQGWQDSNFQCSSVMFDQCFRSDNMVVAFKDGNLSLEA